MMRPRSPQSRRPRYIKCPSTRRKRCPVPPGWVQDNREKTGQDNLRGDAQAMEGEKVKLPTLASELQAATSRRKEASGAVRKRRTADSRSKTVNLARRVSSVKFSQYLQFEMPKIVSRAWARPTHLTHLPCWSSLALRREHGSWHRLKYISTHRKEKYDSTDAVAEVEKSQISTLSLIIVPEKPQKRTLLKRIKSEG